MAAPATNCCLYHLRERTTSLVEQCTLGNSNHVLLPQNVMENTRRPTSNKKLHKQRKLLTVREYYVLKLISMTLVQRNLLFVLFMTEIITRKIHCMHSVLKINSVAM